MKTAGKFLISAIIIAFFATIGSSAQSPNYVGADPDYLKSMVNGSSCYVESLSGTWERSYDEENWESVQIPASHSETRKVYFRRALRLPSELADKYVWQLYFAGIDDEVEIYLNNQLVSRNFGVMAPFTARIPQKMITGSSNTLVLAVSPATGGARQIKTQNIFAKKVYTGIVRDILLVGTPNIWVSEHKLTSTFSSGYASANLNFNIKISSADIDRVFSAIKDSVGQSQMSKTSITVEATLRNKQTNEIAGSAQSYSVEIERDRVIQSNFNININSPQMWTPLTPSLYEASIKLMRNGQVIHEYIATVGLVDLAARGNQLYLNGQPFEMKGISYFEDYSSAKQTLSPYQLEQDIKSIKMLGANVIRLKQTMPNPFFIELCNRNGIFVMLELPVYNVPNFLLGSNEIIVRMNNIADNITNIYGNAPCVLAWGVSDGVHEGSKEEQDFSAQLTKKFRNSGAKLIYKTVILGAKSINTEGYDLIGLDDNRRFKSMDNLAAEVERMATLAAGKPLFLSFGIAIQPENFNGYSDPLSLESQAFYIQTMYNISKSGSFVGCVAFSFNDYELENPLLILNNPDMYVCTSGLVDRERRQRLAFQILQALFNKEKTPLLNAGSYTEYAPVSFIITGFVLLLVILFLVNRFRRFREYLFRAILRPYNFYADIRDQRIMSIVQSAILALVISITMGIFFSSVFYFYRSSQPAQYALMMLIPFKTMMEYFFKLIWVPDIFMYILSIIFLLVMLITSGIIKIFSFFVRPRIFFSDTFIISVWSASPLVLLLPIAMVLIRLLIISPVLFWVFFVAALAIMLWTVMRTMRSSAVVFDVPTMKSYIAGWSIIVILLAGSMTFYQLKYSLFSFAQYFIDLIVKS